MVGTVFCIFFSFFNIIAAQCKKKKKKKKKKKIITKTRLYNFDPLKPHFYVVKLEFTGVYINFLFLLNNLDCGYSLEPPHRHNLCFE